MYKPVSRSGGSERMTFSSQYSLCASPSLSQDRWPKVMEQNNANSYSRARTTSFSSSTGLTKVNYFSANWLLPHHTLTLSLSTVPRMMMSFPLWMTSASKLGTWAGRRTSPLTLLKVLARISQNSTRCQIQTWSPCRSMDRKKSALSSRVINLMSCHGT